MSVTLSLFAGVGAQFLDNNGNILSGGLIYTYSAGTTTPLATFTTNLGTVAQPNPIVLDSAGRIPGGELWLTTGYGYKFVAKDSNGVLIGTYDNVPSSAQPPIINDASSIAYELGTTITAGFFIIGITYFITSVGTTNFQLIGASANEIGIHFIATGVGSGNGTAQISRTVQNTLQSLPSLADFDNYNNFNTYSNSLTNPVNFAIKPQNTIRTLVSKLQDVVSVKDFGAKGDGITDDSVAIQNAITAAGPNGSIYFPASTTSYKAANLIPLYGQNFLGASPLTLIEWNNDSVPIFNISVNNVFFQNLGFFYPAPSANTAVIINFNAGLNTLHVDNCWFSAGYAQIRSLGGGQIQISNSVFENCGGNSIFTNGGYQIQITSCWFGAAGGNAAIYVGGGGSYSRGNTISIVGNTFINNLENSILISGIDGVTIVGNTFRGNGTSVTNTFSNIYLFDSTKICISGNAANATAIDVKYHVYADPTVTLNNIYFGTNAFEPALTANYYVANFPGINPLKDLPRIYYGNEIPSSGTFVQGDLVLNITADGSLPLFWKCTVAGTPGTWITT